jgi:hypothetical protein
VRRRENSYRDPAAFVYTGFEGNIPQRAIGFNFFPRDRVTIYDQFNWHLAGVSNSGSFDIPVGFVRVWAPAQFRVGFFIESRRYLCRTCTSPVGDDSLPFSITRSTLKSSR